MPSRLAEAAEVDALAECLGDAGAVLQIVPEYWDSELVRQRVDELAALSLRHDIATTFAPLIDQTPGLVDEVLAHLDGVRASGARVHAQVQPRGSTSTSASASGTSRSTGAPAGRASCA